MSEEKQIEEITKILDSNCEGIPDTVCQENSCSSCKARQIIGIGYRKQSEWISVDERLPHSQQMVIGYTPCDGYMFVGFYQKVDSPYWKSYWNVITAMRSTRKMTKKVTHWMPLPEPPVMKGE